LTKLSAPAIIIGGGSVNGVGIARNLGAFGIPVYCVTSNPHEFTRYSAFCQGFMLVPDVEKEPHRLRRALQQLARRFREPGVLFPTTDTALLTVSRIRAELPEYVTFIPPRDVVETMVIKRRFYTSLQHHDVPHPRTIYPDAINIAEAGRLLGLPVYLRPSQSLLFHAQFGVKGFHAPTLHDISRYLVLAKAHNFDMLLQQIIPGPAHYGYTLRGYIDQHSHLTAIMATQKIRQPDMFTNISIKRSIPLTYPCIMHAQQVLIPYLHNIGYTGLFHAEFKYARDENVLRLLEINARSSGGNYFAVACGLNHVLMAYQDACGLVVQPEKEYETNVYQINLIREAQIFVKNVVSGSLTEIDFSPYLQKRLFHTYIRNDRLPFFREIGLTLRKLAKMKTPVAVLRNR
jgi:predicted ATP-grasp superfamily ATP-dependent carboligase